jgi:hypothetical protein
LEREEQADDGGDEEAGTEAVDFPEAFFDCEVPDVALGVLEEDEDGEEGDATEGEVDLCV